MHKLRFEYELGVNIGLRTCPSCYDESHPQLDTRNVKTSDKQTVEHSRSETIELDESRRLSSFKPVGGDNYTTFIKASVGNVTI